VSFNRTIQTLKIGRLVLEMFEKYWIDQFAGLLNVVGNKKVGHPGIVWVDLWV